MTSTVGQALAIAALDAAAAAEEGGMAPGCDVHRMARHLVLSGLGLGDYSSGPVGARAAVAAAVALRAQGRVYGGLLLGPEWLTAGSAEEDRDEARDNMRALCGVLGRTVNAAIIAGHLTVPADIRLDEP